MALDTYSDLLSALAAFSVRADQTALWPACVALAEAEFNRSLGGADKPIRPMVALTYADVDEEFEGVPADMIRPVSLSIYTDSARTDFIRKLDYLASENLDQLKAAGTLEDDTDPAWYAVVGPEFRFYPVPTTIRYGELTYVQKIPALSDEAPTNWLLTAHPDAYLYGALVQFAMTTEDERLPAWSQAYGQALEGVRRAYPTETNKIQLRTELVFPRCY